MNRKYKFIIAAGGTGGHIIPGISIYNELKTDNHAIKFVCRKQDYNLIADLQEIKNDLIYFSGTGLRRGIYLENVLFVYHLLLNLARSLVLILSFWPTAIICMGGYITFPVLFIGYLLRIPFFICEQNTYPGIVNRLFGNKAKKVFINFEYSAGFFANFQLTGNPIRKQFKKRISLRDAYKYFNFTNKRKVILIMGGSQGALNVNRAIAEIIPNLSGYNVIWLTGKHSYSRFKKYAGNSNLRIYSYLKEINYALRIADLGINRAGAMSMSEFAFFSLPAIYIPLPHAAENHQYLNAQAAVESGGAKLIEEKDLTPRKLINLINEIIKSDTGLKRYKKNIRKFYIKDSEKKIVKEIFRNIAQ